MEAWEYDDDYADGVPFSSTDAVSLEGDGNSPPVVSDVTPQRDSSILQLLGSIGQQARDLGTALGTAKHDISNAKANYNAAYNNAAAGNSLGTWWMYASTTDKLMVGLGVAGILVVLLKK